MRWLLALTLCWSVGAWGDTWHVCPIAGEYGTEDGTTEANCYDGFIAMWTAAAVAAGDTVCLHGEFLEPDKQISGSGGWMFRTTVSGSEGSRLIFDGDCDDTGDRAILNGENLLAIGFRTSNASTFTTDITLKNVILKNFTKAAVVNYSNATTDLAENKRNTFENLLVENIGAGNAGDNGFDSRGRYVTLNDSVFRGIDEDAVFHRGKYFRSDGVQTYDFSRANANGDGMQIGAEGDGYHVSNFTCAHDRDVKQCFIVSALTDTGAGGIFEDFDLTCFGGGAVSNCAFVTGDGAKIRRGRVRGGSYGVVVEATANATNMVLEALHVTGATTDGIAFFTNTVAGNVLRHSISADNGRRGVHTASDVANTITNTITVGNGECGISKAGANVIETHNDSFGNATDYCLASNATAAGTGSITADPLLDSQGRPRASSPACGAGTYIPGSRDFDDLPMGYPADIGAFRCPGTDSPAPSYSGSFDGLFSWLIGLAGLMSLSHMMRGRYVSV